MSKQPEALRAADWIEHHAPMLTLERPMEAAEAIRRLHSLNAELVDALAKLLRDADSEPDGEYLQGANKGCVAVHRSGIERLRELAAKAEAQQ